MDRKEKAEVIESLPSLRFKVQFADGSTMIAYLGGKLHRNFIRVLIGDKVEVIVPPTGNIGRIVKRF